MRTGPAPVPETSELIEADSRGISPSDYGREEPVVFPPREDNDDGETLFLRTRQDAVRESRPRGFPAMKKVRNTRCVLIPTAI